MKGSTTHGQTSGMRVYITWMQPANKPLDEPVIHAAGGVVCRNTPLGSEVMVVYRRRHDDWTLPKGKVKDGESPSQAAVREVVEETGCLCQLEEYLGAIGYPVQGVPKVVLFWRMFPIETKSISDNQEVDKAVWLPVSDAVQQLTYAEEKTLLSRLPGARRYASPKELSLARPSGPGRRFWLRQKRASARLFREFEAFRVDLAYLETRSNEADKNWLKAAHDQLDNVERHLKNKDIEGGWFCLHAARRQAVFGLERDVLAIKAAALRQESQKVSSWRANAMKEILAINNDQIKPSQVADAMALMDEDSANRYHKIWLMSDQLIVLIGICGMAFGAFLLVLLLAHFFPWKSQGGYPEWGYGRVAIVLFFGLLGAAFSAAQSLIKDTSRATIPERVANHFVTATRVLFGSVAGLAGYAFYQSKVVTIRLGDPDSLGAILTVAFLFGYTGERLIAKVAGSVADEKSQKV